MNEKTAECPLCVSSAALTYSGMCGYVEGETYDVYACTTCDTNFVDPLRTDAQVYEDLYRQADIAPGYERYARYAKLVEKVRNPLRLLSNAESAYWSVATALERHFPEPRKVSVLEIGSGLGYLTYALNRAGYQTVGIDVAVDAVNKAKKRYGDHYQAVDLFDLAKSTQRYDCVVMMEVIEHVEEPLKFVQAALSLLRPGGKLIITTPNKSAAPAGTIWHSDFPPVHLWFFGEGSLQYMAATSGVPCELVDFTPYSKKFYSPLYAGDIDHIQQNVPRLSKSGDVLPHMAVSDQKTRIFGLRGRYLLSYIRRRLKKKTVSKRSTTMCAVMG